MLIILYLSFLKICSVHGKTIYKDASLLLRSEFVPYIDKMFDEKLLFGSGWTAHETLRPLAYSTFADLIHHVRCAILSNLIFSNIMLTFLTNVVFSNLIITQHFVMAFKQLPG